ncbi:MAG: hypothetical protein HGA75_03830 [Thiobacillus sp.]|nr:hypothetical protein [Thiobacillus sp.]
MAPILEYRPLASPANAIGFRIAKTNVGWHKPSLELGSFLVLQYVHSLHETVGLPAQSLREAWEANDAYFRSGSTSAVPPLACLPIYLITVGAGSDERVVYVGQTSSKSSRFVAGHKAMTLLHAPEYEGMQKRLYRCCVVLLSDRKNEIPIEWVTPYEDGRALLSTVEGMLIHWFQPELNVKLKRKPPSIKIGSIHIQNVTGDGSYLNDTFVWP